MPRLLLFLIMLGVGTSAGHAQSTDRIPPMPPISPDLRGEARAQESGPGLKARIGRMFTGAVVGGWIGYFASHVAVSDWDSDADFMSGRGAWALGGVVLGAVTGRVAFGGGQAPDDIRPDFTAARQIIGREDIVNAGAQDAYQLIRSLRKEWLMPRGVNSFRESARGTADFDAPTVVVPGADHVLVYLDNTRLGGTQHLAEIASESLEQAEFIPPAEATFRWGTGHAHGVILLTTLGAEENR